MKQSRAELDTKLLSTVEVGTLHKNPAKKKLKYVPTPATNSTELRHFFNRRPNEITDSYTRLELLFS
jgi:hypothetical protein